MCGNILAVCTDPNPQHIMIAGFGDSVREALVDFHEAHAELKEMEETEGKAFPDLDFTFRYDTVSFLKYYSKIISLAGLQRLTGIDRHQLSHYVTGKSKPSPKTIARIQKGVTSLGRELSNVSLC